MTPEPTLRDGERVATLTSNLLKGATGPGGAPLFLPPSDLAVLAYFARRGLRIARMSEGPGS